MAQQVSVIDVAEPMMDRPKKDGSGTYRAMKITVKLQDGSLKTIMSFDEHKAGDMVSVEEKNGYWNIVKAARGYDKPAGPTMSDVMQALRFSYELQIKMDKKLDALMADIGISHVEPVTITDAVNAATLDQVIPPSGFDKFRAAREEHNLTPPVDTLPDDDDINKPIDLSTIPF